MERRSLNVYLFYQVANSLCVNNREYVIGEYVTSVLVKFNHAGVEGGGGGGSIVFFYLGAMLINRFEVRRDFRIS